MSARQPPRLPPSIRVELEGLQWELVPGRKHWLLRIDGTLVAIWPHGPTSERSTAARNARQVRNAIRKFRNWRKEAS